MRSLFQSFHDVTGLSQDDIAELANEAETTIENLALGLNGLGGLLYAAANNQEWCDINEQASNTALLIQEISKAILCCKSASSNLNYHLRQPGHQPAQHRKASRKPGQGGEA